MRQEELGSGLVASANIPPMPPFYHEERSRLADYRGFRFPRYKNTKEDLSISFRKAGKRLHAICKSGL